MGGLGNQMFQISHAYSQGLKHNRPVVFKPHSWIPLQGRNTTNYLNNIFRNIQFVEDNSEFEVVNEDEFSFQNLSPKDSNTMFVGYFQSSKNFFGFDKEIKKLFAPTTKFIQDAIEKYPQLELKNTVSIHMRIGDYINNPTIHPVVSKEYINQALDELVPYDHIFIFGDNKDYMKKNYLGKHVTIVDEEDWYELWLMSLCKNNVIANSTFSWWGSFLNSNPNKKVFAPSIWFGPNGPNAKDIYETSWKVVPVRFENGYLIY